MIYVHDGTNRNKGHSEGVFGLVHSISGYVGVPGNKWLQITDIIAHEHTIMSTYITTYNTYPQSAASIVECYPLHAHAFIETRSTGEMRTGYTSTAHPLQEL